jgi:hypothetical protein
VENGGVVEDLGCVTISHADIIWIFINTLRNFSKLIALFLGVKCDENGHINQETTHYLAAKNPVLDKNLSAKGIQSFVASTKTDFLFLEWILQTVEE